MDRQSDFILSSDYATISNDGVGVIIVVFPGSVPVPANSNVSVSNSAIIGKTSSQSIVHISSSRLLSGTRFATGRLVREVNDGSADYQLSAQLVRNGEELSAVVSAINSSNASLTTSSVPETFTFRIRTYESPT